ncbi:hypothetical protein L484_023596 [Morus notabilis]|uniref:Uncharacterized protein n=1 Tax=Morus notabilis TaxID=981085 RepID=W9RGF3_9ROSA|nr:hypothetical protein L484_023596 [Morus notabilis]
MAPPPRAQIADEDRGSHAAVETVTRLVRVALDVIMWPLPALVSAAMLARVAVVVVTLEPEEI